MKKLINLLIVSTVIFCSCTDPFVNSSYSTTASNLPAATYMEKTDSLKVSMWVDLLKYTDLFNTINLQADYTCFVPNNTAMQAYLVTKGVTSVSQLKMEDAKLLVRYHTIKGALYSSVDFTDGVMPDTTATGDYLSTAFLPVNGAVQINMESSILRAIHVTNGYIHIIDKVLTPVTETIWDKMQSPDFSIFKQAIEATGYNGILSAITKTEIDSVTGASIIHKYRYTLFAVPNSVFNANGINDLNSLVTSLKAGSDYTSTQNALNGYVAYHLLNQQISYSDLSAFSLNDTVRSKNIGTMAPNQLINIRDISKVLYINYDATILSGVKLTALNRNCKNGVMHVVDGLMPIKSPKPSKIQWELTDYPQLSSLIPNYRVASGTSTYIYNLFSSQVTCYKWLSVPESKLGLYYEISSKNDAVRIKAIHSDYLVLSLGMFGWVEMQSPAIVAGKYKVYIEHFNPKNAVLQGKLSFILDGAFVALEGATVGNQITTIGSSAKADAFLKTLVGTVTFTSTTTHKLRILAGDTFESTLDCLTFEPTN